MADDVPGIDRFRYVFNDVRRGMPIEQAEQIAELLGALRTEPAESLARRIEAQYGTLDELRFNHADLELLCLALRDASLPPASGAASLRTLLFRMRAEGHLDCD